MSRDRLYRTSIVQLRVSGAFLLAGWGSLTAMGPAQVNHPCLPDLVFLAFKTDDHKEKTMAWTLDSGTCSINILMSFPARSRPHPGPVHGIRRCPDRAPLVSHRPGCPGHRRRPAGGWVGWSRSALISWDGQTWIHMPSKFVERVIENTHFMPISAAPNTF